MGNTRDLRVLVIGVSWPPETFLLRLIEGLAHSGIQVIVGAGKQKDAAISANRNIRQQYAPEWHGSDAGKLVRLGAQWTQACLRSRSDVRIIARHFPQVNGLAHRLATWNRLLPYAGRRSDILYFPWNSAAIEHLPLFELGMPVVISCRGSQVSVSPHNPTRQALRDGLRTTFEKAARVHCVSETIRRDAMQYGLTDEKARVIRPAVDPQFFSPVDRADSNSADYNIISVGSLIWRKGYERALMAVRDLIERGISVRYDIVGDGPEKQALSFTIHDLKLAKNVFLAGKLPPAEVRGRLQRADAFLLSSHSEGIANSALEAMSCGLPVVTTNCGGMREAVTDGVEGFVVPVRDSRAMADALECLWKDADLRSRMGAAGRLRVERDFDLKDQIAQFIDLFQSV